MLPFLYYKWRQPSTIVKLRAERAATQTSAIPTQVEDAEVSTSGDKHATDSMASQDRDTDSVNTDIIPTTENEHMEVDSATAHNTKEEDDPETEDASQKEEPSADMVQKEVSATPSKPTYLDAVLQGKFNSFHVLREHREAIMRKEQTMPHRIDSRERNLRTVIYNASACGTALQMKYKPKLW